MYHLSSIDLCARNELEYELRDFFNRLHQIKDRLNQERTALRLNRIQRNRCRQNILDLEKLERDFYALSYKDDVRHVYRKVHRYVKLDHERLMDTFGQEPIKQRYSLFISM